MSGHTPAQEALLNYTQADMDGIMVLTSRQAIHEVCDEVDRLRSANAAMLDALELILPLAKGYVMHNRVGSNDEYIRIAEAIVAKAKGTGQ